MLNISSFCTLSRNPICFKTLTCFPKPPSPQPQFPKRFQNIRFRVFSKHFLCFCFQNLTMSSPSATKIIAEYAKSNRSSCKKCTKSISSKALRLGLVSKDPRGFDATKWHHLECFPISSGSVVSTEGIEGFASLESNDQEELNKLVEKCVKSVDEVSDKGKDAVEGSEEKSSKRTRVSETDEDDKSEEQQRSSKKTKNLPMSSSSKIVAEYAKSNWSSCKKCTKKISAKALMLGLVSKDPRGFDATKWHHLDCFFPMDSDSVGSAEAIEGFASLESSDQEELKKLVGKSVNSVDEVSDRGKDAVEGSEEKISKQTRMSETDEDDKSEQQRSSKKIKNLPMSSSSKIVAEYAKSNWSSCKKCTKKISAKALRLGLVSKDPRGFDATKWHHLDCFFPMDSDSVGSAEAIEGFASLESSDQEELKKLVGKCVKSVDEVSDRGKDAVEGSEEKSSKRTRVSETDEDNKSEEQQRSSKKTKKLPMSSSASKVVAEYAKSNRSSCKKCAEKISAKALRLGLVSKDPRGYDATRWYHLDCFFPMGSDSVGSAEAIEGFASLESSDQEELKKLVGKCVNSVDEVGKTDDEKSEEEERCSKKTIN